MTEDAGANEAHGMAVVVAAEGVLGNGYNAPARSAAFGGAI